MQVHVHGSLPEGARLTMRLQMGDQLLARTRMSLSEERCRRDRWPRGRFIAGLRFPIRGSMTSATRCCGVPHSPTIIDIDLQLLDGEGAVLDEVRSYTALRAIATQGDRFLLNGRPLPLRMVLDQGYWPETGQTAPNDDAFVRDILLAKALGFNGVRKHQKIEDPRFLYWADHLGLLVWEEMPSAYRYTQRSVERLSREWIEAVKRDRSHPCIVSWVPFNESWGVPDLPDSAAQRHYIQALYHLTKTLDPTRPVIGNDGWESVATDIIGIHDYDDDPECISERYGGHEGEGRLLDLERPGGRMLRLEELSEDRRPIMLTEFGGIALGTEDASHWGYSTLPHGGGVAGALRGADRGGAVAAQAGGLLLYATDGHFSGSEWIAVCEQEAEGSDG